MKLLHEKMDDSDSEDAGDPLDDGSHAMKEASDRMQTAKDGSANPMARRGNIMLAVKEHTDTTVEPDDWEVFAFTLHHPQAREQPLTKLPKPSSLVSRGHSGFFRKMSFKQSHGAHMVHSLFGKNTDYKAAKKPAVFHMQKVRAQKWTGASPRSKASARATTTSPDAQGGRRKGTIIDPRFLQQQKVTYKLPQLSPLELKQMPKGRRRHQWTRFKPGAGFKNMAFEGGESMQPIVTAIDKPGVVTMHHHHHHEDNQED